MNTPHLMSHHRKSAETPRSPALRCVAAWTVKFVAFACVACPAWQAHAARTDKMGAYINAATGIVQAPQGFADNDELWRTSWFYASTLLLEHREPEVYAWLQQNHGVDNAACGVFLKYFLANCIKGDEWLRPGTLRNDMTMDQLVPFLYLLMVVDQHGSDQLKADARQILERLRSLEEKGLPLASKGQAIGRNNAYLIDMLLDERHYKLIYRTPDMAMFRISAGFNERVAKVNRRSLYRDLYRGGLQAFGLALDWTNGVLEAQTFERRLLDSLDRDTRKQLAKLQKQVVNDYSAFNALAAASFEAVRQGAAHDDAKCLREYFGPMADNGWGPAYSIVAGKNVGEDAIAAFKDAHVTRDGIDANGMLVNGDNDIIMAQRGWRLADQSLTPQLKGGDGQHIVLDYVILKALQSVWK